MKLLTKKSIFSTLALILMGPSLMLASPYTTKDLMDIEVQAKYSDKEETFLLKVNFSELYTSALDMSDLFYISFTNADISYYSLDDVEFKFYNGSIDNTDTAILSKSGREYVLDLQALYDLAYKKGYIKGYSTTDKNTSWHKILADLEFELELFLKPTVKGDLAINIESLNIKDGLVSMPLQNNYEYGIKVKPAKIYTEELNQKAGKIILSEIFSGSFKSGSEFIFALDDMDFSMDQLQSAKIYTDKNSGLEIAYDFADGLLVIEIEEESEKMAGTITIEEIEFDIQSDDEEKFTLHFGGTAVHSAYPSYYDLYKISNRDKEDIYNAFKDKYSSPLVKDFVTITENPNKLSLQINFNTGAVKSNDEEVNMLFKPYMDIVAGPTCSIIEFTKLIGIDQSKLMFGQNQNYSNTLTIDNTDGVAPFNGFVTLTSSSYDIIVNIGGNNEVIKLRTPIFISNQKETSYMPIYLLCEIFGLELTFDEKTSTAYISK
ncbi:MAG: hypothetical protein ATN31_02150 [Candidatus Epulonipiscioides saccharophilum]|nr:MAG: hypothetical protein ATN31_02150 [Epulopiscium sp. AS2M-Bin001]